MIVIETQRLVLREITEDDALSAYLLNLDPDVVRYTGDVPFDSVAHAREFLRSYDHYKKYGFGRWGAMTKSGNQFIGWCGLKYNEDINEHDIGFRLFKKHWGCGYATEAAKACINAGFARYKMKSIIGRAVKENTASVRVLEKCGLTYESDYDFHGKPGALYRING
jgi:[ribosomal protein S5]-alanine N-acetyltransferase